MFDRPSPALSKLRSCRSFWIRACRIAVLVAAACRSADAQEQIVEPPPASSLSLPITLPELQSRDLEAKGRLFDRGIPIAAESFSPEEFHFAYLHQVTGGFLSRKPERCTFLLDLATLENRALRAPKGRANRISGWDPTGRHLLLETTSPHVFSAFTGQWTTFHWVFDVVTSQFVARKPFTGIRDGKRFRWKQEGTYHGVWDGRDSTTVVGLEPGELVEKFQSFEATLHAESDRRMSLARELGVGTDSSAVRSLGDELARLDEHWTRRGQKDAVVSELFGNRPRLFGRREGFWIPLCSETEYVAVLDQGLALVTMEGARQCLVNLARGEIAPLPRPPAAFAEQLLRRWDRGEKAYDDTDPLPRDLQYRRSWDPAQGTATYYNFVTPSCKRVLLLYSMGPADRILRVVDLPESWWVPGDVKLETLTTSATVP